MGDQCGCRRPQRSEVVERGNELLSTDEVEARRGLIEQQDGRVVHERAGEQHALAFARRQRGERLRSGVRDADLVQELERPIGVGLFVVVPPGFERGEPTAPHDLLAGQRPPQLIDEAG